MGGLGGVGKNVGRLYGLPVKQGADADVGENVNNINNANNQPHVGRQDSPQAVDDEVTRLLHGAAQKAFSAVGKSDILSLEKYTALLADHEKKSANKSLAKLSRKAQAAQDQLRQLGNLTGRNLAAAYSVGQDGKLNRGKDAAKVRKRIESAIEAQAELSEKLYALAESEEFADSPQARFDIREMALRCDARASELGTLVMEMTALAESNPLDEREDLLDKGTLNLMSGMAGGMHGNVKTAKTFAGGKLEQVCAKIAGFANPEAPVTAQDLAEVTEQVDCLEEEVRQMERRKPNEDGPHMDTKLLMQLKDVLKDLRTRIDDKTNTLVCNLRMKIANGFYDNPFGRLVEDPTLHAYLCSAKGGDFPILVKFMNLHDGFKAAFRKLAQDPSDDAAMQNCLDEFERLRQEAETMGENKFGAKLRDELVTLNARIEDAGNNVLQKRIAKVKDDYCWRYRELGFCFTSNAGFNLDAILSAIGRMKDVSKDNFGDAFLCADVIHLFRGDTDVSSVVETRLNIGDADLMDDPDLVQGKVQKCSPLGHGMMNTVELVTFNGTNGPKTRVFKAELPAARYITYVKSKKAQVYGKGQQMVKLNIATKKTADVLGCGYLIGKVTPSTINGRYGMLMEVADGMDALDFANPSSGFNDDELRMKDLRMKDISRLAHLYQDKHVHPPRLRQLVECSRKEGDKDLERRKSEIKKPLRKTETLTEQEKADRVEFRKICNEMLRQQTDMRWLDVLTGQWDRHCGNYMVSVKPQEGGTYKVQHTGIDNDMCFQSNRPGLTKYRFGGSEIDTFRKAFRQTCQMIYGEERANELVSNFMNKYLKTEDDETYLEFDVNSKDCGIEVQNVLRSKFDHKSIGLPPVMSAEMHERLKVLGKHGAEYNDYLASLRKNLKGDSYKMAERRLDEMIKVAAKMPPDCIIDSSNDPVAWTRPQVVNQLFHQGGIRVMTDLEQVKSEVNLKFISQSYAECHVNLMARDMSGLAATLVALNLCEEKA